MSTFAIPNEKRGTIQSLFLRFSRRKDQKETSRKFIEKTENCTRSKYRENTIYREALILLKELGCQNQAFRNIRDYTMKSLILAQDER